MFVPKKVQDGSTFHIPCLIQQSKGKNESNKYLFYFHGNAEDIFNSTSNIDLLRNTLPYNTVAIEYPGYSLYYQEKSSATIEEDALTVFDYFVKELGINEKDIIVCGRSIGSGPAVYLAAHRNPGALMLISPFKSIRETASSILGLFKYIVAERFKNINIIHKVTCPLLLIHGQKDTLISYTHSVELSQKTSGPYELILPEEMDHNEFNLYDDFLEPISKFLLRHNLLKNNMVEKIHFKKEAYEVPEYIIDPNNDSFKKKDFLTKVLRKMLKI
jgi:fermentation-respiration switch protein FrsA (DUF1100 family)